MTTMQLTRYNYVAVLITAAMLLFTSVTMASEVVNINRASAAAMIENWKGIGEVKARAIVAYRKKNGNYSSIDDLLNVTGIGEGLIKKNRRYMSVSKGLVKPTGKTSSASSTSSAKKSKSTTSTSKSKSTSSDASTSTSKSSKKSSSPKSSSKKSNSKKSTKKKSSKKKTDCTSTDKKKCKKTKKKKTNSTT